MGIASDTIGFYKQRLLTDVAQPRLIKEKRNLHVSGLCWSAGKKKRRKRENELSIFFWENREPAPKWTEGSTFASLSFASLQGFPILSSKKTWKKHGSLLFFKVFTKPWVEITGHCVSMPWRKRLNYWLKFKYAILLTYQREL